MIATPTAIHATTTYIQSGMRALALPGRDGKAGSPIAGSIVLGRVGVLADDPRALRLGQRVRRHRASRFGTAIALRASRRSIATNRRNSIISALYRDRPRSASCCPRPRHDLRNRRGVFRAHPRKSRLLAK
jgi:hypothetical protein